MVKSERSGILAFKITVLLFFIVINSSFGLVALNVNVAEGCVHSATEKVSGELLTLKLVSQSIEAYDSSNQNELARVECILKGYVKDMETNETLEGIKVGAHAEGDGYHGENITNASGYYEFHLSPSSYYINARDDMGEYCEFGSEGTVNVDSEVTWFNISLRKRPPEFCTLRGYVRDSKTGSGIVKARVDVWDNMGYTTGTETKSFPAGYFEVNTANGSLKVRANKEDYLGTEEETVVMVDYQVTWQNFTLFYAPQNSVVKGYVKEPTGTPLPNLRVGVSNQWNWGTEDYTDETGYYVMNTIAGELWLNVWKEGYYYNETEFDIAEGETKWINITMYKELSENATICGYINDSTGNPISNARIRAYGYGDWEKETWTNSSGGYKMNVVATADLNVNLTLLVTADQHGPNTTTFSVGDNETKQINLNLEKDSNPPEIDFNITLTENISTNNPTVINGTIKEKYLEECSIYLAQYKETQGGQKAYVVRAFYRYTAEENDGWIMENELNLTPTADPEIYKFTVQWDATTEGGWLEYAGTREYVIPNWYNPGQFNIDGMYYNSTNPTERSGDARFNKITGMLDSIRLEDIGMEIYPEDDPTGMFAASRWLLFFDADTDQLLGSENRMGAYFSTRNVTFEYDLKVPTDEYAVLIIAGDYGNSENLSTEFIRIDNTNPKIDSITITPETPLNATNATFTITFNEEMCQSVQLNVSFGLVSPYTTHTITGTWQTSTSWQGTYLITNATGDGVNTMRVADAVDSAKNVMESDTNNTFIIDTTKPTLDILSPANNTTTNQSVILIYSVSDNIATLGDIAVNIGNGTIYSDEGNFIIIINATDGAGNTATDSVSFIIDKTLPSIVITNVMNGTYYNVSVTPVIEVTDPNLNTSSITLNGTPFTSATTIIEEGNYTLSVEAFDKAGNRARETIFFAIDTTKPVPNAGDNKTIDQSTTLTLNGSASTDINGSGIVNYIWEFRDGILYTLYGEEVNHTFHNPGNFTITLTIRDAAGNLDTDTVVITVKDNHEPTIDYTYPMLTDQPKGKAIKIELKVTDNVEVANVTLYYRGSEENIWKSLPMTKAAGDLWSVTIPGEDIIGDIFYYFVATDTSGNNITKPADGKENPYKIGVLVVGAEKGLDLGILGMIVVVIIVVVSLIGLVYYKKRTRKEEKVERGRPIPKPLRVKPEHGYCYVVREAEPEQSFKIFTDLIKKGATGLCVTRANPENIKSKYGLKESIYWLTKARAEEYCIDPTHLEKMVWLINDFIKSNKNSVILLDGIEYLTVQNTFLSVLKSLHVLKDTVSVNKSLLIIPLSPTALSEKELSLLERDFKVI